jgi:Fe-S-cluster-containing hydrogenase component 2
LVTSLPLVCQQCSHAPCIEACPTEALFRVGKDSPLIIDEANCTACGNCVDACPAGCITLDEKTHIPLVCDLCGGDPQCVILCHSHCLTIGDDMGADNTYRIERLAALLDAEDLIMKRAPEGDR